MDSRQLRKLSRLQLLEMLIQKTGEADRLRSETEELRRQVQTLTNANALADAASRLSSLMEDGSHSPIPAAPDSAEGSPEAILAQARQEADRLLEQTRARCAEMVEQAQEESRHWWEETARKMDAFYAERLGLRELLADSLSGGEA